MPQYGKNDTAGRLEIVDRFIALGHRDWLPVYEYPNKAPDSHWMNAAVLVMSGVAHEIDLNDEQEIRIACKIGLERIQFGDLYKEWRRQIDKFEQDWTARAQQQQPTEQADG